MPAYWTAKDERKYKKIAASCVRQGRYGKKRCKNLAAAVVNRDRGARKRKRARK